MNVQQKNKDFVVIVFLPIIAALSTVILKTNLLTSVILFFGVPAMYIAARNSKIFPKSFIFAFLLSIPLSFFVDTLAAINGSWIIPHTIFPFKFFGVATIEVYFFSLMWVLYAVLFYEYFFDKSTKKDRTSPHIKYIGYITAALVLYVIIGFLFDTSLLHIPYLYFLSGMVTVIIPLILFLYRYPKFVHRYIPIGAYFFFLLFLFEIAALQTGQWIFPAKDYIGFINIFGYQFPFEELIIWMSCATLALLSYYEFFDDDLK